MIEFNFSEDCYRQPDDTFIMPNPGWCMTATEEYLSRLERGYDVTDELMDEVARENDV